MSKSSHKGRYKRESHFARNLAAIRQEFKLLLGTFNPVSAFNYLHNEGIVSQSQKEELDRDLSRHSFEDTDGASQSVGFKSVDSKSKLLAIELEPEGQTAEQIAYQKLTEIVESKEDLTELRAIVTALTAFQKLHQVVKKRRTIASMSEVKDQEDAAAISRTSEEPDKPPELPGEEIENDQPSRRLRTEKLLLSAFELGTHSPEELLELLRDSGDECAVAELSNSEKKTLLHLACCMQPVEIVKTLITKYNCDPNAIDSDGNTPLHEASRCRKAVVAKYLVNLPSCNPNIINNDKETPLHLALRKQHWRLSKVILKSTKIDKTIRNGRGESLFELVQRHPQVQEREKFRKYLHKSPSVLSNVSVLSTESEEQDRETRLSSAAAAYSGRKISQTGEKLPRGTFSSSPQAVIKMDDFDSELSGHSVRMAAMRNDGHGNCLANTCFTFWVLSWRLGCFVFALLVCIAVLICVFVLFPSNDSKI